MANVAFIPDYAAHLAAMIARGESIANIDVSNLTRDRVKILRRMQAGLSAGTVALSVDAQSAPSVSIRRKAPRARLSKNASRCACANCRRGAESLCAVDR